MSGLASVSAPLSEPLAKPSSACGARNSMRSACLANSLASNGILPLTIAPSGPKFQPIMVMTLRRYSMTTSGFICAAAVAAKPMVRGISIAIRRLMQRSVGSVQERVASLANTARGAARPETSQTTMAQYHRIFPARSRLMRTTMIALGFSLCLGIGAAHAAMVAKTIDYGVDGKKMQSVLVYDDA